MDIKFLVLVGVTKKKNSVPLLTQFPTRYELLRLGMGQEVAARRAFIATRGGLSWPSKIFCHPLSHLVLLNCWLKLAYYTTVIISGSLSACLLFQSNLAASINIVKIIAWARYCRGGSSSCKSWRGGSSSCRGRKMQANRMRRLLKTTLPRMQPPCSRVDSNRGSMMFAQNVQQRLTSTVVGKTSDDSNLVARNLKFAKIAIFSAGGGQNLGCTLWGEEGKRALCVAYLGWQCQTHLWLLSFFSGGSPNIFLAIFYRWTMQVVENILVTNPEVLAHPARYNYNLFGFLCPKSLWHTDAILIFMLGKPLTLSHTRWYFDPYARKVLNLVTMVVELADFTDITQVLLLL